MRDVAVHDLDDLAAEVAALEAAERTVAPALRARLERRRRTLEAWLDVEIHRCAEVGVPRARAGVGCSRPGTQPSRKDLTMEVVQRSGKASGRAPRANISVEIEDRDGDIIRVAGIDTAAFERNPVVLFSHDHNALPIGRATSLRRSGNALVAEWEWAQSPRAQEIREAWETGFISGTSIGFIPLQSTPRGKGQGRIIERSELLEFSVVSIPANAAALAASVRANAAAKAAREAAPAISTWLAAELVKLERQGRIGLSRGRGGALEIEVA